MNIASYNELMSLKKEVLVALCKNRGLKYTGTKESLAISILDQSFLANFKGESKSEINSLKNQLRIRETEMMKLENVIQSKNREIEKLQNLNELANIRLATEQNLSELKTKETEDLKRKIKIKDDEIKRLHHLIQTISNSI